MTAMFNIPDKPTNAQHIRSGLLKLRVAIDGAILIWFGPRARLDDDANQTELSRLEHRRREEIRRGLEELRRLDVLR